MGVEQGLLVGTLPLSVTSTPKERSSLPRKLRIRQARHIGQPQGLIGQDGGGHQLDGGVLRPRDRDLTVERAVAVNRNAVHVVLEAARIDRPGEPAI
jgi:hypothetical protein